MKKGILIISICILASILIFETSKYTARKSYHVEDDSNTEVSAEIDSEISLETDTEASADISTEASTEMENEPAENLDADNSEVLDAESDEESHSSEPTVEEKVSSDESIDVTEIAEDKRMLVFLDAYKETYQAEIDPLVREHDYDLSCFVNDGCFTRYVGDDRYSYRLGVDVSHHDGEIDWKAVKDAGIEFAILRIGYRGYGSEGTLNEDKMFRTYIEGAHEAGLDVGCYIFSQAINTDEAREEAQLCLDILKDYELELPVVYDPESILNANARTDYVSGEQFTENTIVFCEMIKDAGYQPMIYSNMLWEAFQFDLKKLSDYPIWYADYEPLPQTPYNFEYWQYSNTGNVPGISEMVDLDIQLIKN